MSRGLGDVYKRQPKILPNISSILSAAFFDMRIVSPVFLNLGNIYPPFVIISVGLSSTHTGITALKLRLDPSVTTDRVR